MNRLQEAWLNGLLWLLPPALCAGMGWLGTVLVVFLAQELAGAPSHPHGLFWANLLAVLWVPLWAHRAWGRSARHAAAQLG